MTGTNFLPPDFAELASGLDTSMNFAPKRTLDDILPPQRIHKRRVARRQWFDYAKADLAASTLAGIPTAGETWHLVTGATYSPIDLLAAIVRLVGTPCRHLWIATLATNERSISALADMRSKGQLQKVTVLLSEFFRDADSDACQAALAGFRAIGATAHHAKCHAKVYLLDFDIHAIVVEGSANLRNCRSVEQLTITNDRALMEFYQATLTALTPL